jgi:hypothetical protein
VLPLIEFIKRILSNGSIGTKRVWPLTIGIGQTRTFNNRSKSRNASAMQLLLTFANLVLPVAVLVFASGFFPHKPFLPGLASHKDLALDHGSQNTPSAKFDRVIFMVIDALRSDFIFSSSSGFAFTQK